MTSRQAAVLLALAAGWGASFLFIRVLVDGDVGATGVSAGRCSLGFAVLLPLALARRTRVPRARRTWAGIALLGLLNMAIPWTLIAVSEQHVPSGVASVANSSNPLWAAIFAFALFRADPLSRTQRVGLSLGFAGILVLSADGLDGFDGGSLLGTGLITIATMCYALSAVFIRRWFGPVQPIVLAAGQLGTAAAVLWPFALGTGAFSGATMGAGEWGSLLALGGIGSGVCVAGYMWLIGQVGAVRAGLVTYLVPPVGVVLGWLVLDEAIGWNLLAGLVFVIGGVALVQGWGRGLRWRPTVARREAAAE